MSVPAAARSRWVDLALALVVAAAFQGEIWLIGDGYPARPVAALIGLAMTVPLVLRRRAPVLCATVTGLSNVALLRLDGVDANQYLMAVVVLVVAAYSAGHHPDRVRGALGGVIVLLATSYELLIDPNAQLGDFAFITLIIGGAWTAGLGMQQRERRAVRLADETVVLRQQRDTAAEDAAQKERARIARELHDIISHSVSVMVLQAGAAGEVLDFDPAGARRSLDAVQQTGRQALVELRRLLGVLGDEPRPDSLSPQPGVEQLPALVDTMRAAGMTIDLHVQGTPRDLSPGVDVSVYRIIQEALTNCARHAGPSEVHVVLGYDEDALAIEVRDTGGRSAAGSVQPGRGLVGMRERVVLHSGRFEAGPELTGGFAVRAWLPLDGGSR